MCLVILIMLWLIRLGNKKRKAIMTPNKHSIYRETYCTITLRIIFWAQVCLWLIIGKLSIEAFGYLLGNQYSLMSLPINLKTCNIEDQVF